MNVRSEMHNIDSKSNRGGHLSAGCKNRIRCNCHIPAIFLHIGSPCMHDIKNYGEEKICLAICNYSVYAFVLFGHLFYSLLHVQAALSVLLTTLAGFGGAMSGTAILLETLKLRKRWQAWLNQQPSSEEVYRGFNMGTLLLQRNFSILNRKDDKSTVVIIGNPYSSDFETRNAISGTYLESQRSASSAALLVGDPTTIRDREMFVLEDTVGRTVA